MKVRTRRTALPSNVRVGTAAKAFSRNTARPAAELIATVGAGLTQATPDFLFGVAMPVRF
jgi:hypothetical protein